MAEMALKRFVINVQTIDGACLRCSAIRPCGSAARFEFKRLIAVVTSSVLNFDGVV